MYRIRVLDTAAREMAKLDKSAGRRVVERIHWLAANLNEIKPEPLKGDLTGFYRLRAGSYRVVYEILHGERTIVIHLVGHRSQVYRKR